jgi:hypothetical protein
VNRLNNKRARIYAVLSVVLALTLATLFMWGERKGLLSVLAPDGTSAERDEWRHNAYQNWWASTSHPAGAGAHFLVVALALYVVIAQTHIGVYAVRTVAVLPRLVQVDANWVNPDGDYGWTPLRPVFRTVWISMALYGLLVSGLAVALGLGTAGWIPALVWMGFLAVYLGAPWSVMLRIEAMAQHLHIAVAVEEAEGTSTKDQDELAERVKLYRKARIRPMTLGAFERVPLVLSVLLPIFLNILEPYIHIQSLLPK